MRKFLLVVLVSLSTGVLPADTGPAGPFSFVFSPLLMMPLGAEAEVFSLGGGARLSAEYSPPSLQLLSLQMGLAYDYQTLQASAGSISNVSATIGGAWRLPIGGGFSVRAFGNGGYSFGFMNGDNPANGGASPVVEGGAGLIYSLDERFSLRLDTSYIYYVGLFGGANVALAMSVTPAVRTQKPRLRTIEIGEIELKSAFPVLHAWYDQHPVGKATIRNIGKGSIPKVRVSFFIRQYMDGPKECALVSDLKPGEAREVPLYALFNASILNVTEGTKATSEVEASFEEDGQQDRQTKTATIRIYNRNAMTWDDDRKAAAFVSGKDPWVLELSNNVTAMVKGLMNHQVDRNLQLAIAFHGALRLSGVSYTPNPTTPYSQSSGNPEIVDFLKFPRQTLAYKAGDCSDLSILYASFFESVGIETAFITVPGHIFMAIELAARPEEARSRMSEADLIFRDGKVWLPIETTVRDRGLLEAWREAAREWKQASVEGSAAFYPVHEAWKSYEPVGLPADSSAAAIPETSLVARSFVSELSDYTQQELDLQIESLTRVMESVGGTARDLNSRGVIYAKYGRMEQAEKDFQEALRKQPDYLAALVNLGNIARLKPDARTAYLLYKRAAEIAPANARVRISLSLAERALGREKEADDDYKAAAELDPGLAAAHPPSGKTPGTRAAEMEVAVLWCEE